MQLSRKASVTSLVPTMHVFMLHAILQFPIYLQVVLVGDCSGDVTVYLLRNIPSPPNDQVRLQHTYMHTYTVDQ